MFTKILPEGLRAKAAAALVMVSLAALPAVGAGLNDTGITLCADTAAMELNCQSANALSGQDAFYGRDTLSAAEKEQMVGASGINPRTNKSNGFDFTKIANNGLTLPAMAMLDDGSNDWACTRDNVTGLVWEVKTTSGLHNQNHTYSWYKTGLSYRAGNSVTMSAADLGVPSGAYASEGVCETAGRCDTEKFVQDVNHVGLCGFTDWRMPSLKELQGILDFGRISPAIDSDFFPNTPYQTLWWSGTPDPWEGALAASFGYGAAHWADFGTGKLVRLVRGVQ